MILSCGARETSVPEQAPWVGGAPSAADTAYLHCNLIGSTERMTGPLPPPPPEGELDPPPVVRRAVFTAFGEPIDVAQPPSAVNSRYGYAGAWGYQGSSYAP